MTKRIYFTFDYELFLGHKSGSVSDCIIEPTNKLLDAFSRYGYKLIFFVDTTYLTRLKEESKSYVSAEKDYIRISDQLNYISNLGHYIFPHIHAHWRDARYLPAENEWNLMNLRYYRFAGLPENTRQLVFSQSVHILNEILANPSDHVFDSYRAGGWCIQPFSVFRPFFEQYGIKNDWSVIPGKMVDSTAHQYDFRKVDLAVMDYGFDGDICLPHTGGRFREWTISSIQLPEWESWLDFKISGLVKRFIRPAKAEGTTVKADIVAQEDVHEQGRRVVASLEHLNLFRIYKYLSAIKRSSYFQFISHPKLINSYDFRMIKILLKKISRLDPIETDYRKE